MYVYYNVCNILELGEIMARRVNYLNNKDILKEIHKSKATFCSYTEDSYADFDIILLDIDKINIRTTAEAKKNKAKQI